MDAGGTASVSLPARSIPDGSGPGSRASPGTGDAFLCSDLCPVEEDSPVPGEQGAGTRLFREADLEKELGTSRVCFVHSGRIGDSGPKAGQSDSWVLQAP